MILVRDGQGHGRHGHGLVRVRVGQVKGQGRLPCLTVGASSGPPRSARLTSSLTRGSSSWCSKPGKTIMYETRVCLCYIACKV